MIMISSDSCLLFSLLFPLFFTRAFPILERGFASYLLTRKAESALCRLSPSYKFLSPPLSCTIYLPIPLYGCRARRGHWTDFTRLCTQKERNARFHAGFVTRMHKRFYHHKLSRLQANKSLISTSDLNFDSSLLPFSPLLLPRKINHEEEEVEEEASDQRRSKVEDVEEKGTKRKERNAEEIARRKQGAETVTETETAATSGYPLSASSIVVITRKRKLRGSETVGKVVKVGWGGGG